MELLNRKPSEKTTWFQEGYSTDKIRRKITLFINRWAGKEIYMY